MVHAGDKAEQWRLPTTPDVCSPLVHDGLVYLCQDEKGGRVGRLRCVDAKNGRELYSEETHPSRYRASPVYADGKVYLTARDGTVTVVKAGPKFEMAGDAAI